MLRRWLEDALKNDSIIPFQMKYALAVPASLMGGWLYTMSGSWLTAIQWCFWFYVLSWLAIKPIEWLGYGITYVLLRFLSLFPY